jgi:hypothetical protein
MKRMDSRTSTTTRTTPDVKRWPVDYRVPYYLRFRYVFVMYVGTIYTLLSLQAYLKCCTLDYFFNLLILIAHR